MAKQQMKIRDVLQHVNGTLVLHRSSTDNRYWPYTDRNTRIVHEFLLLILMFYFFSFGIFVLYWNLLEFPVLMQNVYTRVIFAGDSNFFSNLLMQYYLTLILLNYLPQWGYNFYFPLYLKGLGFFQAAIINSNLFLIWLNRQHKTHFWPFVLKLH